MTVPTEVGPPDAVAASVPERALGVLAEGRQVHVAVAPTSGPHVTPELYAWWDGRLWFASATSTLKSRVLRREPSLGAVVGVPGRHVLLRGDVEVFDPLDVPALVAGVRRLPGAAHGLARYTVRNAPDLLAFAADLVAGRLGRRIPPVRVLFALTPRAVALVENDVVTEATGTWSSLAPDRPGGTADDRGDGDAFALPAGGEPAVAALAGPLAVPVRWFPDTERLFVVPSLLPLVPSGELELSVVVDDYAAPGPAAKQGTLLRGTGRLLPDEPGMIALDAERRVAWDGVAIDSNPV